MRIYFQDDLNNNREVFTIKKLVQEIGEMERNAASSNVKLLLSLKSLLQAEIYIKCAQLEEEIKMLNLKLKHIEGEKLLMETVISGGQNQNFVEFFKNAVILDSKQPIFEDLFYRPSIFYRPF